MRAGSQIRTGQIVGRMKDEEGEFASPAKDERLGVGPFGGELGDGEEFVPG